PHLEPRVPFLYDRHQEWEGNGHRRHPALLGHAQEPLQIRLPLPGVLPVVQTRRIDQVVEADPPGSGLRHVFPEPSEAQGGEHERGTPPADSVGGELAEELRNGIPFEGVQKVRSEICGDGELHMRSPWSTSSQNGSRVSVKCDAPAVEARFASSSGVKALSTDSGPSLRV